MVLVHPQPAILLSVLAFIATGEVKVYLEFYVSGFFLAGVSILNLCVYPKLASGAMCMEVSSVFLSTYLGDMENPGKSHEF